MSLDLSVWESGAAEGTRTPDPIITNFAVQVLDMTGRSRPYPDNLLR